MQLENLEYELDYNIDKVWNKIYTKRKEIFFRNEKFIETKVLFEENKRMYYFLEDKTKKVEIDINFIENKNNTILKIVCSVKLRSIVKDLFSYLSINIKKDFDEYINKIEGELRNEI